MMKSDCETYLMENSEKCFNKDNKNNLFENRIINDDSGIKNNVYYEIKEVNAQNLEHELKNIKSLIDKEELIYVGIDTEFPGIVYNLNNINDDFYYKNMKLNVDSTKLIQLGITLTNRNGKNLKGSKINTWQFNFQFDLDADKYNEKSINLLKENGINFKNLKKIGINHKKFAAYFMKSGLIFNKNVKWVSYHGLYDFGYLLRLLTNEKLEENEFNFIKRLKLYFPSFYDIKILIKDIVIYFNGGLNKLISILGIKRKGINH